MSQFSPFSGFPSQTGCSRAVQRLFSSLTLSIALLGAGILAGCDQKLSPPAPATSTTSTAPAPGTTEKICFQCNGTGKFKCSACKEGKVPCPAPCLKLSDPGWVHHDVAGHPPTDLWMFYPNGQGYNQNHAGHLIVFKDGAYPDTGVCKQCGGTTKVTCSICQGTGETTCGICEGKKVVPASWTAFDNPKLKNRPNLIQLKNGSNIFGKITMTMGGISYVKTENGKELEINSADIVSKAPPEGSKD